MKRLWSLVIWAAISAAFIGPGTVATAGAAGARHDLALCWAIALSTVVCLVLQEASARITIISGHPLAAVISRRFGRSTGYLVVGGIVLGCAAFEAGNILGAASGAALTLSGSARWLAAGCGLVAGALLCLRRPERVARLMAAIVAVMGVAFLLAAVGVRPSAIGLLRSALVPVIPEGSGSLVLALFGTTVVPYNLFLGSGLARGKRLADARLGLAIAVPLGGLITMGVLVVGTTAEGEFGFASLSAALTASVGEWARLLFALGLLAAGLSSAVTAPLAAALAVESVRSPEGAKPSARWPVWFGVLLVGIGFGVAGVQPIPAIIAAQAANGIILPFVAVFLLLSQNDRQLMGDAGLAGRASNILVALSVLMTFVLGVRSLARAVEGVLGFEPLGEPSMLAVALAVSLLLAVPIARTARRLRTPD